jgi:hypothetical protein
VRSPIDLKLGGTSGQVLGTVWYVVFYIIVCLEFVNVNKENKLYGSFGRLRVKSFETWWMSSPNPEVFLLIWHHFEKTLKRHQYGYQMKGLCLRSKNMLFIFRFSCLFTFCKHKQLFWISLLSWP